MTSTPSVCLTNIEQYMNRSPMTIAVHLLDITIRQIPNEYEMKVFGNELATSVVKTPFMFETEFEKLAKSTFGTGRK